MIGKPADADAAARDALLARRLASIATVSALTAEALRHNQKRAGIEMETLRVDLEIRRNGASPELVRDLHEAERNAAAILADLQACEDRIAAAEAEVEVIDRALAATGGRTREPK